MPAKKMMKANTEQTLMMSQPHKKIRSLLRNPITHGVRSGMAGRKKKTKQRTGLQSQQSQTVEMELPRSESVVSLGEEGDMSWEAPAAPTVPAGPEGDLFFMIKDFLVALDRRDQGLLAAILDLKTSLVRTSQAPEVRDLPTPNLPLHAATLSTVSAESPRLDLPTAAPQRGLQGASAEATSMQASSSMDQQRPGWRHYTEPKIPPYQMGEDIENYLLHFERIAKTVEWPESEWACRLVPLLSGLALEAYNAMDEERAQCYTDLKAALLTKFNISPETYRQQFRSTGVPPGENPMETYYRLKGLYRCWIRPEQHTKEEVGEALILEQLLWVLPGEVRTWVGEHEPADGLTAAKLALQYHNARRGGPAMWPTTAAQQPSLRNPMSRPARSENNQKTPGITSTAPNQRQADKQLFNARKEIVERVTNDIIVQLLDGLLAEDVLNSLEMDSVIEENNTTADKARCLIDKVRKKGPKASEKFFYWLQEVDPVLCDQLNLPTSSLSEPSGPTVRLSQPEANAGPTIRRSQPEANAGPTVRLSQPEANAVSPVFIHCTKEFKSDLLKKEADSIYIPKEKGKRRRMALLINNVKFDCLSMRRGAEKDQENMEKLLKDLDYTVEKHRDLSAKAIDEAVQNFSQREEHSESDSTFVVIMSHGKKDVICGVHYDPDVPGKESDLFSIDNIFTHLNNQNCPGLRNKPKVILIQACRGDESGSVWVSDSVERPLPLECDGIRKEVKEKDIMCFMSCTPGSLGTKAPPSLPSIPVESSGVSTMHSPAATSDDRHTSLDCHSSASPSVMAADVLNGTPPPVQLDTDVPSLSTRPSYTLPVRTSPYHPRGNPVERYNRTLLSMLGTLKDKEKSRWRDFVKPLTHAYNCTKNEVTGFSPYELMFGRQPRLPIDITFGLPGRGVQSTSHSQYVRKLKSHLKESYELAMNNAEKVAVRNKRRLDKSVRASALAEGDRVLVRNLGLWNKHKLADRWEPSIYRVIKQVDDLPVYVVQPEGTGGPTRTLHRDLLLPCGVLMDEESEEHMEVKLFSQLDLKGMMETYLWDAWMMPCLSVLLLRKVLSLPLPLKILSVLLSLKVLSLLLLLEVLSNLLMS
ncbi:hypothetical protein GJAV_G00053280 [Gymnothorax javanicus]|nr:hypothetical protein GJAV_G00053280 [Gymnothorax javanicus]